MDKFTYPAESIVELIINIHSARMEGKELLGDVEAIFQAGKLIGITGPNGGGKTTLLRCIAGIQRFSGYIWVDSTPINRRRHKVALLAQAPQLKLQVPFTTLDVVLSGALAAPGMFHNPRKADYSRAKEILHELDLNEVVAHPFAGLSGGESRRALLGRCLMGDADIYLLDEPYSNLDSVAERIIRKLVNQLVEKNKIVLVVDHHLQHFSAEGYRRILLLKRHKIAFGSPEEILKPEVLRPVYGQQLDIEAMTACYHTTHGKEQAHG